MNIAIITGEASGDRAGAQLAQEIRQLRPDAVLWGTGGKFLRDAGVEVLVDSSRWGVIGVASGLAVLPRIMEARGRLHRELKERKPDVLIPVDAGAFNVGFGQIQGLCPWTREHLPQTRILYYFPPGSWRKTLKGSPLARMTDKVATPFPWSETELRRFGVDATFVGHPLLDLVKPSGSPEAFTGKYGIQTEQPLVGLLPGSRKQEIEQILPLQLAAASIIHQRVVGVQFALGLAPTVDKELVLRYIEEERVAQREREDAEKRQAREDRQGTALPGAIPIPVEGGRNAGTLPDIARRQREWIRRAVDMPASHGDFPLVLIEDATYDLMAASDALLITSGTATLEAAILGKPMVITYRMEPRNLINHIEYMLVKKRMPEFVGMPNILAGREICPEFIQDRATPEALAEAIIALLLEPERMLQMRSALHEATAQLGEPGGAARTARMVVELAEQGAR